MDVLTSAAEPHMTAAWLSGLLSLNTAVPRSTAHYTLLAMLLLETSGHFLLTDHFHLIQSSGLNFSALQDAAHHSSSLGIGMQQKHAQDLQKLGGGPTQLSK